jgi:hypothetical protein
VQALHLKNYVIFLVIFLNDQGGARSYGRRCDGVESADKEKATYKFDY